MQEALAHSLTESLYEPLPEGIFQYKLDWDPTLLLFVLLSFLYYRGLKSFRKKKPIRAWQILCFYLGICVNIAALLPPIDPLSDRLFFMHMIQHLMIVILGVPLMMFGAPFFVVIRGVSPGFRRHVYFPLLRNSIVRRVHQFFSHHVVALAVFEGNLWFWHVPRFYNWALLNDWVHLIEHGTMALSAIYLWRNIIDPYPLKSPLHMGFRLLYLGAIMALDTVLSAALSFADTLWYAYEGIPMPAWWAERWTHLDDQRLGGLIMWVPGEFILFLAMTICFFVWVQREQKKERSEATLGKALAQPEREEFAVLQPVLSSDQK